MERVSIAVQGGLMRGAYSAAVLEEIRNFYGLKSVDVATGNSAGVGSLAFYVAGNDCFTGFWEGVVTRSEFMSFSNIVRKGRYVDVDYATGNLMGNEWALDTDAMMNSETDMFVNATDTVTGEPKYFSNRDGFEGCPPIEVLRACMAVPYPLVYGKKVSLNGTYYVDGGYSDPLPIDHPAMDGTRQIIILTASKDYPSKDNYSDWLLSRFFKRSFSGKLYESLKRQSELYREKLSMAEEMRKDGAIVIRPDVNLSRTDNSRKNIRNVIELGRRDAQTNMELANYMDTLRQSDRRDFYFGDENAGQMSA
jgi:predicted patatin/cPLA2 family phospholipase